MARRKEQEKLIKVKLHGLIGERCGKKPFQLAVSNVAQMWGALEYMFEDFQAAVSEVAHVQVLVKYGNDQWDVLEEDFLFTDFGTAKEVHIVPKMAGSGVEIAAWMFSVAATSTTAIVVGAVINIGISIAVSAVVTALSSKPATQSGAAQGKGSNLYSGAALYTEPGGGIEIHFGEVMTAGTLIGHGVNTDDISIYE